MLIARVAAITGTLGAVFAAAEEHSITPLAAARRVAGERLEVSGRQRAVAP
jgi:hypothetical protein